MTKIFALSAEMDLRLLERNAMMETIMTMMDAIKIVNLNVTGNAHLKGNLALNLHVEMVQLSMARHVMMATIKKKITALIIVI